MKINFTPLLFVLGFITAHSQITTNGQAQMFVSSKTLVYSTGDIAINGDKSKITNRGNIRIKDGTYNNKSTDEDSGILLTYTDEQNYGQLIINSPKKATGKIKMEKVLTGYNKYAYFGSPFSDYKFEDFAKDVTGSIINFEAPCKTSKGKEGVAEPASDYCSKWGQVPIFVWNNEQFRYDPDDGKQTNNVFTPGLFYDIRKSKYSGLDSKVTFTGIPYVADQSTTPIKYPERNFKIAKYDKNKEAVNVYSVKYYTYISDVFVPGIESSFNESTDNSTLNAPNAKFADKTLQLFNPFTSNLDLKTLTNNYTGLVGIGSYGGVTVPAESKKRYSQNVSAVTIAPSGGLVGPVNLSIIPPITNFFIKAAPNSEGGATTLDLYNSNNQTFETSGYAFPTSNSVITKKLTSTSDNIYQINLRLFNKSKDIFYNETYIASGSEFETAVIHKNEVYSSNSSNERTSIYTLPEAKTGGIDPALADVKLYINVMNSSSEKIAIPVGIEINKADGSTFVITSELAENGKLLAKGINKFNDSNADFYFHDKKLGKSILIDANFNYEFTQNESTNDRFEIYWGKNKINGGIGEEIINGPDEAVALDGLTIVYKSEDEYKVHFNKNWKKADVKVFSILGQLISSAKNINTEDDYLLPIKNVSSSMFIVKITNEKGDTITKKIIK